MKKKVIGLTGGIASGKSTAAERLRTLGAYVIDADEIARDALKKGGVAYDAVCARFPEYVKEDGEIARGALGAHVFADENERRALEELTHPAILSEIRSLCESFGGLTVIDAPLLIETGLQKLCDTVWLVTADEQTRIERACKRSGLTREQAIGRIRNQMSDGEKRRYADRVIDNSGDINWLYAQIDALFAEKMNEC